MTSDRDAVDAIIESLQEAIDGRIASVTIQGVTYDRLDVLGQALCEARFHERNAQGVIDKLASLATKQASELAALRRREKQAVEWLEYYTRNVASVTADKVRAWIASPPSEDSESGTP